MSKVDKRALRDLAEKATPGPWVMREAENQGGWVLDADDPAHDMQDQRFIAAANPAAVLALLDEIEALRTCLAETAGVAVTMLYESHKADTIKEFTVEELSQMVETTKHLADANVPVEKVYRKAWGMAQGGVDHG